MPTHSFAAELWPWDARRQDTWVFVTVPEDVSTAVADEADARGPSRGFGSVRVEVRLGRTTWRTSVFPDSTSGCFVLPVKKAVRRAEGPAGDRPNSLMIFTRRAPPRSDRHGVAGS